MGREPGRWRAHTFPEWHYAALNKSWIVSAEQPLVVLRPTSSGTSPGGRSMEVSGKPMPDRGGFKINGASNGEG